MNLLEIVQSIHVEGKLPGTPPTTVVGQVGRAADLVRWAIAGYNDVQNDNDGKWKWLRGSFTVNTVANQQPYLFGACTDVEKTGLITRFRAWDLDWREPPLIYLVSDGQATERELTIDDWQVYRQRYKRATHTASYPGEVSVDALNSLYLGPKPDGIYHVAGNFWRGNQVLAADDDTPEMPAAFHMVNVFRSLTKYGYNTVSQSVLARCQKDGQDLYEALVGNQKYSRFSLGVAGPLA